MPRMSNALKAVLEGAKIEDVPVKVAGHVNGAFLKPGGSEGHTITGMRFTVDGDTLTGTANCGDTFSVSIPHFRAMLDALCPPQTTVGNGRSRKTT